MADTLKTVLITGGSGTVGSSFIRNNLDKFNFISLSRNEEKISLLSREFPSVKSIICDIQDMSHVSFLFEKYRPDIVIHAAALKHVNLAEKNPTKTVETNIKGSLNVIKSSILSNIPITVGISTDKACDPDSVYGYTKYMMEKMFLENFTVKNKFICTRFANVAKSNGSVIPFWKKLAKENKPLLLTDKRMNRLMFSQKDASDLILNSIEAARTLDRGFIMSKIMKKISMHDLALEISENIKIIGKRQGEKLNETLISGREIERTQINVPGFEDYIFIFDEKTSSRDCMLKCVHSSLTAEKMTNEEIRDLIK